MSQKIFVFFVTFFAYAGLHTLRQGWAYSKSQVEDQFHIEDNRLGIIDTLYIVFYSIGLASIANLSKYIRLQYFVGFGMLLAIVFYLMVPTHYLIFDDYIYVVAAVSMCLNGLIQSTGWPGVLGIMGNWFGKGKRGLLMACWAMNANIGNIMSLLVCNLLQSILKVSWIYNFYVTSGFTLIMAGCMIFLIKQKPNQKQISILKKKSSLIKQSSSKSSFSQHLIAQKNQDIVQKNQNISEHKSKSAITVEQQNTIQQNKIQYQDGLSQSEEQQNNMNVFKILLIPKVPFYVIGFACIKACIYGMLFQLPSYLDDHQLLSQKGYIASMVDVGSFIGGLLIGHLGDILSYRALFLSPILLIGAVIMFFVQFALTDEAWIYYIAILCIGITTGGPYNIIKSAIAIDLGQQIKGQNVAMVGALLQGSAAMFASISLLLISLLNIDSVFYMFGGQCFIASIALFPLFISDLKSIIKRGKKFPYD